MSVSPTAATTDLPSIRFRRMRPRAGGESLAEAMHAPDFGRRNVIDELPRYLAPASLPATVAALLPWVLSRQLHQPTTVRRQPPFIEVGDAEHQSLLRRRLHVPGRKRSWRQAER